MCLTTDNPIFKVAQEDIIVFKRVNQREVRKNFFRRLFSSQKRETLYQADVMTDFFYRKGVITKRVKIEAEQQSRKEFTVNRGYHSFVEPSDYCNAVFVIPKGTRYIAGRYGGEKNYASERIIMKGTKNEFPELFAPKVQQEQLKRENNLKHLKHVSNN